MTIEEAICELRNEWNAASDNAIKLAVRALTRDKGKAPHVRVRHDETTVTADGEIYTFYDEFYCPECFKFLGELDDRRALNINYCSSCGRAIDWSAHAFMFKHSNDEEGD